MPPRLKSTLAAILVLLVPAVAWPHGSVTNEDDLCAIRIGYLRAHFKIYLPETHRQRDYCEDLPATGQATFVMEYIHRGLGNIPVEFRIVRNVTGMGRFARIEHVRQIDDLDAITELHVPAMLQPDVFTVMHHFSEAGEYIGIVTASPTSGKPLSAVFPFDVGFTGFGYWPLIGVILVALQLQFLYMSGRFPFRGRRRLAAIDTGGD